MPAKTIRTKPFLLATAGSTVDGRTIDDKMITEMAKSYDPKTYGARVNIEHIRGISADAPFHAYGDVAELSTGEVEVNFNGKTEKRLGLFGTFDMLENAQALNAKGQKVYPSIEINPNFGDMGFAYLMGCALTDSPASIATERLQFNRTDPSRINLSGEEAALLEFVEEATGNSDAATGFLKAITDLLKPFAKTAEPVPAKVEAPAAPAAADMSAFAKVLEGMATQFDAALQAQTLAFTKQVELIDAKVSKFAATLESTPAPGHQTRPLGTGADSQFAADFV